MVTLRTGAEDRLIITGASAAFADSLLALLGSLNCNWPGHPPVRVYDIGLGPGTLDRLAGAGVDVVTVPEFCPHWRQHQTWKPWCWVDAPARHVLWLDAGVAVLAPLEHAFTAVERLGYLAIPNYHSLVDEASEAACRACGVTPDFRRGKPSIAAGVIGFSKRGPVLAALEECLAAALVEEHIAAAAPGHRHEQALIALLLHKHLGTLVLLDGTINGGWTGPAQVPGQRLWVHRRTMAPVDLDFFAGYLSAAGPAHRPLSAREARARDARVHGRARLAYWRLREWLRTALRSPGPAVQARDKVWPDRPQPPPG